MSVGLPRGDFYRPRGSPFVFFGTNSERENSNERTVRRDLDLNRRGAANSSNKSYFKTCSLEEHKMTDNTLELIEIEELEEKTAPSGSAAIVD